MYRSSFREIKEIEEKSESSQEALFCENLKIILKETLDTWNSFHIFSGLLTFLEHPEVEPTNNRAERGILNNKQVLNLFLSLTTDPKKIRALF